MKNNFVKVILMMMCYLLSNAIDAQQNRCHHEFKGQVLERHSNLPIDSVKIILINNNDSCYTDEHGHFELKHLCQSIDTLLIFGNGYWPYKSVIDSKTNNYIVITLDEDDCLNLEKVIIRINVKQEEQVNNATTITADEIYKNKGNSVGEILSHIPGATSVQNGPNVWKPMIMGLSGQRIAIIADGIKLDGQQWGTEHAPEIETNLYNDIQIIKGASGLKFGSDALGGAIVLTQDKINNKKASTKSYLGYSSNGNAFYGTSIIDLRPKKKHPLMFRLVGSYKKNGTYHAPNYFIENTGVNQLFFSGMCQYKKYLTISYANFNNTSGIFTGAHIGNLTDLENILNKSNNTSNDTSTFSYNINNPYQKVNHQNILVKINLPKSRVGDLSFIYNYQSNFREEYDIHGNNLNNPSLSLNLYTNNYQLNWTKDISKHYFIESGVQLYQQQNIYDGKMFIPNYQLNQFSIFTIHQATLHQWTVESGLRYEHRDLNSYYYKNNVLNSPARTFQNYSFSLGGIYHFEQNHFLKLNINQAKRPPHVSELYTNGLHHGAAAYEIGNENLLSEKATTFSINHSYNNKNILFDFSAYANQINNYIYLKPTLNPILTIRGAFPVFEYHQTNALLYGFDYLLADSINRICFGIKGMHLIAYNLDENIHIPYTPSAVTNPFINIKFRNKTNPLNIKIDLPFTHQKKYVIDSLDYSPTPNSYLLCNINFGKQIITPKSNWQINFGINNMFNKRYRNYLDRLRYFTDALGRNYYIKISHQF